MVPPQALDLEEAVLGACISVPIIINEIINWFKPEVFYKTAHQHICTAILELYSKNKPIDIHTVTHQLKVMNELVADGAITVTQLTNKMTHAVNTKYHMLIVYQKFMKRELIRICTDTASRAFLDSEDVFDLSADHDKNLKVLDVANSVTTVTTVNDTLEDMFKNMIDVEEGTKKNYYQMNPKALNQYLMLCPGNLILVAGKSGSGKTSLISEMMFSVSELNENVSILWYSMEDMPVNIVKGYISSKTFLTANQLSERNYILNTEEKILIVNIKEDFNRFDIEFVGKRTKIKNIRSHFNYFCDKRRKVGESRLYILVIDNIMKLSDQSFGNKQTEIDDYISTVLGDIYDEHKEDSIIIAAHHFDKKQFSKENIVTGFRPTEEHLRGSARLSDISTQIVLLNNPKAHDTLIKEYNGHKLQEYLEHVMIADVIKNRFVGTIGVAYFLKELDYRYFEDL